MPASRRTTLLSLAKEIVIAAEGPDAGLIAVVIESASGSKYRFVPEPGDGETVSGHLSAAERAVSRVLTDTPQTAKEIVTKAGYKSKSHIRAALASLSRKGQAARTPDGYVRLSGDSPRTKNPTNGSSGE